MKKLTLTEKQKKVLKATAIVAGGVGCAAIGVHVISRTELGAVIKDRVIHRMMRSKCGLNGIDIQMSAYTSKRVCPDKEVSEKAFTEAYKVFTQIIQESKDI